MRNGWHNLAEYQPEVGGKVVICLVNRRWNGKKQIMVREYLGIGWCRQVKSAAFLFDGLSVRCYDAHRLGWKKLPVALYPPSQKEFNEVKPLKSGAIYYDPALDSYRLNPNAKR